MSRRKIGVSVVLLGLIATLDAWNGWSASMSLLSYSFANDGPIGDKFACSGADHSPQLYWTGTPDGAVSYTLIVEDPDAPGGTFIHWVVFNLPPTLTTLAEGAPPDRQLATGGAQGINDFGKLGYSGPCPPRGATHHYHFKLYALNAKLTLEPGAKADAVKSAINGHVLATAELIGTFER